MKDFTESLAELDRDALRRRCRTSTPLPGGKIERNARICLNFASNDYLGLAQHPAVVQAAVRACEQFGAGTGSARLLGGTTPAHVELETTLAEFKGTEAALAFSSGYALSLGVIPALIGAEDVVILDKLSHACLIDGAKLSSATLRVFPHNDLNKLESHLEWARAKFPDARVLVITESVFSMDGDTAPLREIVELKDRFDAQLWLDEAHAVGVFGKGLAEREGVAARVDFHMGTMGKALGSAGGYLASSRLAIDYLINKARSFIFSTAPGAAACAAATAAIRLLETDEGREIQAKLWRNIALFDEAKSAIVPMAVGSESSALRISENLFEQGILAPAVRYPTVPRGKARLRVSLSAAHEEAELRTALGQIQEALR